MASSFVKSLSPADVPPTLRSSSCTDSGLVARLLHVPICVVNDARCNALLESERLDSKRTREVRNSNCRSRNDPSVRPSVSFARHRTMGTIPGSKVAPKPKSGENLALHEVRANGETELELEGE